MKKVGKIVCVAFLVAIMLAILYVINGLFGNPVSKLLARHTAKKYIAEHYAGTDFEIEEAYYNLKTSGYGVKVISPTSRDTSFRIYTTGWGIFTYDSYEDDVLSGMNTLNRLNNDYRDKVDAVLTKEDFPYITDIVFGTIENVDVEVPEDERKPWHISMDELVPDQDYDIFEVGKKYGKIVFYAEDEDVSIPRACEMLMQIREKIDENHLSFAVIDFVLEKPRTEEGKNPDQSRINIENFSYEDIYAEDLEGRVTQANDVLNAYYNEQDELKQTELE